MKLSADAWLRAKQTFVPLQRTATANGTGIENDKPGYGDTLVVLSIGAFAAGTLVLKIQESSDDGSSDAYADVVNAVFGSKTTTDANKVFVARIDRQKREAFLRGVATMASTPDATFGVIFIDIGDEELPVVQENTVEFDV